MATPCRFCGLVTEMPHETQQACIAALQEEIARVRGILDHLQHPGEATRALANAKPDDPSEPDR